VGAVGCCVGQLRLTLFPPPLSAEGKTKREREASPPGDGDQGENRVEDQRRGKLRAVTAEDESEGDSSFRVATSHTQRSSPSFPIGRVGRPPPAPLSNWMTSRCPPRTQTKSG